MTWDSISETNRASIRSYQRSMLMLALLCELFLAADWYAFAAVIPFISPTLGLDEQQAGFAQGIFALTYGIGMVVWSPVSRRMSARTMLLIGLAGTGIGMVAQIFVQGYGELVGLRLLIGFFDAAIFIGNMKLIFGWFPQGRRGSIVGLILAAYSLAITLDFALGIPLTLATSWRVFFAMLAAGTLIVAVLVALFGRSGPAEIGLAGFSWGDRSDAQTSLAPAEIFRSRWIAIGALGIGACTFAIAGTATWVVPGYIAVRKMPVELAPVIGTLMGLSQVLFLVLGGYLSDKFEKTFMIKLGVVFALLVAVLFTFSMIYEAPLVLLVALAAVSGLAVFGGGAIFALMSEKYPPSLAPAAVGYAEVFGIVSSFIGPWMMGAIITWQNGAFAPAFWAFAAVEVLFLLGLVTLTWRLPAAAKSATPA
jgi:MFS family permease